MDCLEACPVTDNAAEASAASSPTVAAKNAYVPEPKSVATVAYCWHVQGNPKPEQAIAAQLDYIDQTRRMGILPQVVTVSQ